jgi:hypothetical protein
MLCRLLPSRVAARAPAINHSEEDTMTLTDAEFQAEVDRRKAESTAAASDAKAKDAANKPDKYYAVKTGDTLDSIAKELGHEGEGQALFDYSHDGGVTNGEQIANHDNLIRGANGEARTERGALVPVVTKDDVTPKTKLVEGMALLLPKGW